jgi:hypothetical protein
MKRKYKNSVQGIKAGLPGGHGDPAFFMDEIMILRRSEEVLKKLQSVSRYWKEDIVS